MSGSFFEAHYFAFNYCKFNYTVKIRLLINFNKNLFHQGN